MKDANVAAGDRPGGVLGVAADDEEWPPHITMGELLRTAARAHPDRVAMVFPDARATYCELYTRVRATARGLLRLGVKPGSVVATLMPNCLDHVVAILGATAVGAICMPINTRFRTRELSHVVADANAGVLLTSLRGANFSDLPARLADALPDIAVAVPSVDTTLNLSQAPSLRHIVVVGEGARPGMLGSKAVDEAALSITEQQLDETVSAVTAEHDAIMLYTSGTTALPKGCALRHRQMTNAAIQIGDRLGTRDGDRVWDALPLFHASSLLPMLATFNVAGTFISQPSPEPKQSLDMIQREGATLLWPAFTPVWQSILAEPDFDRDRLRQVRAILCVGPAETLRHLESRLPGVPLLSCYGITEGTGVPVMVRWDDEPPIRLETGGLPLDGVEAKIVGAESREPVPPGTVGELMIRGTNVFRGYHNDIERTSEAFDPESWFATGDLATMDDSGRVTFEGRIKDMLKVGGENVGALEIEAVLSTHPAVKVAAVVGAPDARLGEVPAAYVELKDQSEATESDLVAHCASQIASYKVPRYVRFLTEWPMSATKIRKVDLREWIVQELGGSVEPSA